MTRKVKLLISEKGPLDNSSPGQYPFTAGIHEEMYRSKKWNIKQYAGYGDAKSSNRYFKELIDGGSSGISIAFDLPTQMGIDPNSELAKFEVGKSEDKQPEMIKIITNN
jgi:methylmalonyl-CoA mutase N-terminal domain/subunit